MIGYTFLAGADITLRLPRSAVAGKRRQLYRYTTTWVSDGSASRVTGPASYIYLTPNRLGFVDQTGATVEVLPDRSRVPVCHDLLGKAASPFAPAAQSGSSCFSRVNGLGIPVAVGGPGGESYQDPYSLVVWHFPLLIAAIDPAAEAKLDGLNAAVTSGHYLSESAGPRVISADDGQVTIIPVLAAASSGIGEYAVTRVQRLATPAGPPDLDLAGMRREAAAPGTAVQTVRTTPQQAYRKLLAIVSSSKSTDPMYQYWSVGPTSYRAGKDGSLTPVMVHNPLSVWRSGDGNSGMLAAPMDNADNQYRTLQRHELSGGGVGQAVGYTPALRLVGTFDTEKIEAFDPLTRVPLGGYEPTVAAPASAASRSALDGQGLLPNLNLGGYVSQPVQLVTALSALPALENSNFSGDTHASDPISVIRVRVAGVTGANAVSRERVKEVAQQIALSTGLDVDIVAGSSLVPTTISLPAGKFGQPPLQLTENWVKKGVALTILTAVDKKSVVLFVLILLVCALFVANSATAAVRGRRRELGVLACLGWTRPRLFGTVLGELAVIGLTAGIAGALISVPTARALHLHVSPGRAALAIPVAVTLAVAAGTVPAWLASRADPVASVRPPVLAVGRGRQVRGITSLALVNVLRTPGRTLVGALSLATGVAALTLLTAVTLGFRGTVVGSLLGDAVAVQVRGVDYVAVIATVVLGVLAVADVLFLNLREQAGELATIRASGWPEAALSRLVISQGILIGIAGSVTGAILGLAGAALFAGTFPARLWLAAAAAMTAGVLVTAAAALLPAQLLRRLPTAHLLAEE
jgi:hypothetical protein